MLIALIVVVVAALAYAVLATWLIADVQRGSDRELERQRRLFEQRENLLLNRLAHAYDKPYDTPPIDEPDEDEEEEDDLDDVLLTESGVSRENALEVESL